MSMRLLFVTGSLVHGGAERHSITLLNRLAERGHDCHAIYIKDDPSQLPRIRLRQGGTVRCLHARAYLDPRALRDFALELRRLQPTVIVAANGYALMNASLARAIARSRAALICTFHTTDLSGAREQIKMLIERPFFWDADCAVFVCQRQREHWRRRAVFARANHVIHNGVDAEHFHPLAQPTARAETRAALGMGESDYVIGLPAVMRPEKNHSQLVRAIAALRGAGIPARALMIGDGPERMAVEALARQLGVAAHIAITGLVQDVRPWLAACDVALICSIAVETFSLAALEAMAMARAVVHADLGGAAEMVTHGHDGLLFAPGDDAGLVRGLTTLATAAARARMGENARRSVELRFAEPAMIDRYEALLLSLSREGATVPSHKAVSANRPRTEMP